ncbi:glyoxylate reductase/hydroxypyruvate reductase [Aplysia californica]|uniref:Glyoxylate reductase/hydroxypyruvate reductase n=1 Tax=Aplysia californica TaxID=6500 RepID=A0ABM0KAE9_APLCA|nr:glyoxylate reductase/hydroxypyruvate reductase [Aplysia californica]
MNTTAVAAPPVYPSAKMTSPTSAPLSLDAIGCPRSCPESPRSSPRPLVYISRRIPQKGVETLLKACDVKQWDSELAPPRGELLHSVVGVDGILCMPSDVIDVDVMDAAGPNLRVVATLSCETGHIDVAECERRAVDVITIPLQPPDNFAELTVALMLLTIKEMLTDEERVINIEPQTPDLIPEDVTSTWRQSNPRLIRRLSEEQLAFQWSNGRPSNTDCLTWKNIAKKTFGVYGLTKLGESVVKLLKTFGAQQVLVADCDMELDNSDIVNKSHSDYDIVSFDELLERAEVICVCGSVGDCSENVFCRESFKKMSSNAILVTSQSEEKAIDYVDLYEALRDGQIKAAGLNDCNQEPVPFKTPLLGLRNCIFLPQTEESVYDMRHKVSGLIAKNLIDALKLKREKLNVIIE